MMPVFGHGTLAEVELPVGPRDVVERDRATASSRMEQLPQAFSWQHTGHLFDGTSHDCGSFVADRAAGPLFDYSKYCLESCALVHRHAWE